MTTVGGNAFAQASAPVTSSVLVQRPFDSGNSAVNENFQYIAHPPVRPVAPVETPVARGSHRGRRGQSATTDGGTNQSADATANAPAAP
jgi:hypothetical protein